jgi:hypothetical protein
MFWNSNVENVWEIVNEDWSYNSELVPWLFSGILSYVMWKFMYVDYEEWTL